MELEQLERMLHFGDYLLLLEHEIDHSYYSMEL